MARMPADGAVLRVVGAVPLGMTLHNLSFSAKQYSGNSAGPFLEEKIRLRLAVAYLRVERFRRAWTL